MIIQNVILLSHIFLFMSLYFNKLNFNIRNSWFLGTKTNKRFHERYYLNRFDTWQLISIQLQKKNQNQIGKTTESWSYISFFLLTHRGLLSTNSIINQCSNIGYNIFWKVLLEHWKFHFSFFLFNQVIIFIIFYLFIVFIILLAYYYFVQKIFWECWSFFTSQFCLFFESKNKIF